MICKLMITAVLSLAFSGFVFAEEPTPTPTPDGDNAIMLCKFGGDVGKKDVNECHAVAIFDKTMPEFHHPVIGELNEGFKVACDGDIKYVGKVEYGIHPDFNDIVPYKVDSFFKGVKCEENDDRSHGDHNRALPFIKVENLNWAHLRGEYVASLSFISHEGITGSIEGVCKFKRAHDPE